MPSNVQNFSNAKFFSIKSVFSSCVPEIWGVPQFMLWKIPVSSQKTNLSSSNFQNQGQINYYIPN